MNWGKVRIEGNVEFFGQDIYDPCVNLNRLRRQIGMVFQKPNPFPSAFTTMPMDGVAGQEQEGAR